MSSPKAQACICGSFFSSFCFHAATSVNSFTYKTLPPLQNTWSQMKPWKRTFPPTESFHKWAIHSTYSSKIRVQKEWARWQPHRGARLPTGAASEKTTSFGQICPMCLLTTRSPWITDFLKTSQGMEKRLHKLASQGKSQVTVPGLAPHWQTVGKKRIKTLLTGSNRTRHFTWNQYNTSSVRAGTFCPFFSLLNP